VLGQQHVQSLIYGSKGEFLELMAGQGDDSWLKYDYYQPSPLLDRAIM
jgi:hypothetical protein